MSTRTTKVYSITMPPEMGRQAEQLAKQESRTMSELMREAFRRYQREEQDRRLLADPDRRRRLAELKEVVVELREEAKAKGLASMSMREINATVAAARRDHKKRTTKHPAK